MQTGENVYSAWMSSDSAYQTESGTSMSTPHVTGTLACFLSQGLLGSKTGSGQPLRHVLLAACRFSAQLLFRIGFHSEFLA